MMQELNVMRDGMRIYGQIRYPEGEGPFPVALFSHGFGAARVYEGEMWRDFVEQGIAFVAFDFCGGGPASRSDGTMLDMSVLTEAADLNAMIDAVRSLDKIDDQRLFLVGSSQGGYVSAYVAAQRPADVRSLVLFFPAFCIGDDAAKRLDDAGMSGSIDSADIPEKVAIGEMTVGRRYVQDALSTDILGSIGGYDGDVLIVHGSDDEIAPPEYSLRAVQIYGASAELVVLGAMRHGFRNSSPEHCRRAVGLALEFIARHVA